MNTILTHLKSLGWLGRHLLQFAGVMAVGWTFAGPVVRSYGGDLALEILTKQGLDPAAIAEMKQQGIENGQDIGAVKGDVKELQDTLNEVSTTIAAQTQSVENVERLVQELVRAQLNRRSGSVEDIPPFPGEAPP
jgi:hypothetical protein